MPSYRVLLEGRPVLLANAENQEILRLGFFTTRWVRADSPVEARRKARELVVRDLEAKGTKNTPDEPPTITASEVVGLVPRAGGSAYRRFVAANEWVFGLFPNFRGHAARPIEVPEAGAPAIVEGALDFAFGRLQERLAPPVVGAYLRRRTKGALGVTLGPDRLKLHLHDHRPALLASFEGALREAEGRP